MNTLYEVPFTFRITLIREVGRFVGDTQPVTRATPFVLIYRSPDAPKAENMELTDELFKMYLTLPPDMAKIVNKHTQERFQMSDGMLDQLLASPKSLLEQVNL
jgi:hypothetical protein